MEQIKHLDNAPSSLVVRAWWTAVGYALKIPTDHRVSANQNAVQWPDEGSTRGLGVSRRSYGTAVFSQTGHAGIAESICPKVGANEGIAR